MFKLPKSLPPSLTNKAQIVINYCEHLYPIIKTKLNKNFKKELTSTLILSFLSTEDFKISKKKLYHIIKHKQPNIDKNHQDKIKSAMKVCHQLPKWNPTSMMAFKEAHQVLMGDNNVQAGRWRKEQVVVYEGKRIAHVPPRAKYVTLQMKKLFEYIKSNKKQPWLIKACLFHYGIQNIHPFYDGNGRMGRVWQHRLLLQESPIFNYILFSQIITSDYAAYYKALDLSDQHDSSFIFVEYCLSKILLEIKRLAKQLKIHHWE